MRRGRFRPAGAALAAVLLTGCAPFAGPAGHPAAGKAARPGGGGHAPPPVLDHVRTADRVVFLTYDDGADRDPRLAGLVRERRLPVTLFLSDTVAGPAYGRSPGCAPSARACRTTPWTTAPCAACPTPASAPRSAASRPSSTPASASAPVSCARPTGGTTRRPCGPPPTAASRPSSCGGPSWTPTAT